MPIVITAGSPGLAAFGFGAIATALAAAALTGETGMGAPTRGTPGVTTTGAFAGAAAVAAAFGVAAAGGLTGAGGACVQKAKDRMVAGRKIIMKSDQLLM